jgi:hypothetical protein
MVPQVTGVLDVVVVTDAHPYCRRRTVRFDRNLNNPRPYRNRLAALPALPSDGCAAPARSGSPPLLDVMQDDYAIN